MNLRHPTISRKILSLNRDDRLREMVSLYWSFSEHYAQICCPMCHSRPHRRIFKFQRTFHNVLRPIVLRSLSSGSED